MVNIIATSLNAAIFLGLDQRLHVLGVQVVLDRCVIFISAPMSARIIANVPG